MNELLFFQSSNSCLGVGGESKSCKSFLGEKILFTLIMLASTEDLLYLSILIVHTVLCLFY